MQPETKAPVMDIAPPPKSEQKNEPANDKSSHTELKAETKKDEVKASKPQATVEKKGSSAVVAVLMTILVMGLLAGLAVYAYLKQ